MTNKKPAWVPREWVSLGDMKPWIALTSVLALAQSLMILWYSYWIVIWESPPLLWRMIAMNVVIVSAWFIGSFKPNFYKTLYK